VFEEKEALVGEYKARIGGLERIVGWLI